MYLLRHRVALIRTAGDLNKEVARVERLIKGLAFLAIVIILSFMAAQIYGVEVKKRLDPHLWIAVSALRTAMLGMILILYIIVTNSLRNELKRLNSHGLRKELNQIKWLKILTGLPLALYCAISLASTIYYSVSSFEDFDPL